MKCRKGIRFNWFFVKFWAGSIIGGVLVGNIVDKLLTSIPDLVATIMMISFYLLPAVLGIPLFLKEKVSGNT